MAYQGKWSSELLRVDICVKEYLQSCSILCNQEFYDGGK